MGNQENLDHIKMSETVTPGCKFLNLFADIKGFPQTQHDLSDSLLKQGVLPKIEFANSDEYRTGKLAGSRELADAGIKCKHSIENDGAQTTTADYGNGVVISTTEGGKPTDLGNGHKLTFKNNVAIEIQRPNHARLNGDVVDPKGRMIAKHNQDGSYTVDTDKGFFTQRGDGTIRKETAIRSRNGKDFEVLDTETPLGNLKPSDMTNHRK
ncbi:hypothetical protein BH10CYA1_BH10CYA1_38190 [soil metagenome]